MTWQQLSDEAGQQLNPLAKNLGAAVIVLVLVVVVYRLALRGVEVVRRRGTLPEPLISVFQQIARWTAIVVGTVLVLQCFGVLENAWTALAALLGMVAVGFFALWSVLSNVLCALVLLVARPFRVGDVVEIIGDGVQGRVVNFDLLFTTLRAENGDLFQVPNNVFLQKTIRRMQNGSSAS
jgi:small-conductance mechanosensitive channel